jgi:signal transduction histidine kinase
VDILPDSRPSPDENYFLLYDHPFSFESHAWLSHGRTSPAPVCIMNAGYSSGWCEESFGIDLVASEVLCRAKGDDACRFIMAHPSRIEHYVERYIEGRPDLASRLRGYEIPDFFSRKRVEEELRVSHAELERRVDERTLELSTSYARLQAEIVEREQVQRQLRQAGKLEAIGRLAGGIAHDFNNLMSVIMVRGDLLSRHLAPDDPLQEEVDEVIAAARRAATLTQQLLAFSRIHVITPQRVDLSAMVATLAKSLMPLVGEDIELELELDRSGCVVQADPSQLEQVIMNLVVNARDAMPRGGALRLQTGHVITSLSIQTSTGEPDPGRYAHRRWVIPAPGSTRNHLQDLSIRSSADQSRWSRYRLGLSTVYGVAPGGGGVDVVSAPGPGYLYALFPGADGQRPIAAPRPSELPLQRASLIVEAEPARHPAEAGRALRLPRAVCGRSGSRARARASSGLGDRAPAHRRGDAQDDRSGAGAARVRHFAFAARAVHVRIRPGRGTA